MKKFSRFVEETQQLEKKSLEELFHTIVEKYLSYTHFSILEEKNAHLQRLRDAFEFAKHIHKNQRRDTGSLYFTHPLIVTIILQSYNADIDLLCATLLHDCIEDSEEEHTAEKIKTTFGEEVYLLIEGVSKADEVAYENAKANSHAQTLKKIFLCASRDARILVIKIADRIHNISTIGFKIGEEKRKRKIQETLEVFVSASEKLGLDIFKNQLLNACSFYTFSDLFFKVENIIEEKGKEAQVLFETIKNEIQNIPEIQLKNTASLHHQTPIEILYRPYTVSYLLQKKNNFYQNIQASDLFYIDVVTNSQAQCYEAISWFSKIYNHNTSYFKDLIANTPENGYTALKTSMVIKSSHLIRFHFVTHKMKEHNNMGIFGSFQEKKYALPFFSSLDIESDTKNFIGIIKNDLLSRKICVHNPFKGKLYIPVQCRILDTIILFFPEKFIYVKKLYKNGIEVGLNEKIGDNDIIECEFSEKIKAKTLWMDFLYSGLTRSKLQNYLKKNEEFAKYKIGKNILQNVFDQFKEGEISSLMKKYPALYESFYAKTRDDLYVFIAEGMVGSDEVFLKYEEIKIDALQNFSEKKNVFQKIQGFFSRFIEKKRSNSMRIQFSSPSLTTSELLQLLTKKCLKIGVVIEKIRISQKTKKNQLSTLFTKISSPHRENLFHLFSYLKSRTNISSLSYIPPLWFYAKIFALFAIPLFFNTLVFSFLLHQENMNFSFVNMLLIFLVMGVNTFTYSGLSQYFQLLRKNTLSLVFFFFINIVLIFLYFYIFIRQDFMVDSFALFFLVSTLLLSSIAPLFLFIKTQKLMITFPHKISLEEWEEKKREKIKGYILRGVAIFIFGLTPIVTKYYLSSFSGFEITSVSFLFAFLMLTPFFFFYKRIDPFVMDEKKKYNKFFWIAIFSDMTLLICYFFSLNFTSASSAITFLNFSPLAALIIGIFFWKQKKSAYMRNKSALLKIVGMFVLGTIGVFLLILPQSKSLPFDEYKFQLLGNSIAFVAMIFDVIATLALISYTKEKNIFTGFHYIMRKIFIIGLILSPIALYTLFQKSFSFIEICIFLFLAFFNFIIAYLFSFEAYKKLNGLINFLFFNLSVVITIGIEFLFFGLEFSYLFILGVIFIIFSSFFSEVINTQCEKKSLGVGSTEIR